MKFYDRKARELEQNFFTLSENPAIVTVGEHVDAASVPQGAFGIYAGSPCAMLFLPPDSLLCGLLHVGGACSVSFFDNPVCRDRLAALTESARLEAAGLSAAWEDGTPYCEQADTVLLCRCICTCQMEHSKQRAVVFLCAISRTLRKRPGFRERLVGCC